MSTTPIPPALAGLAAKVPGYTYAMLTQDEGSAETAYESALAYCRKAESRAGRALDWSDGQAVVALRKRFVYELYVLNDSGAVGADHRRGADELLAGLLGDAAAAEAGGTGAHAIDASPAVGVVKPGRRPPGLDGFRTR